MDKYSININMQNDFYSKNVEVSSFSAKSENDFVVELKKGASVYTPNIGENLLINHTYSGDTGSGNTNYTTFHVKHKYKDGKVLCSTEEKSEIPSGVKKTNVLVKNNNICIPIGFTSNDDYVNLLGEEFRMDVYNSEYKELMIPEILDYEKERIYPVVSADSKCEADKIELILNFRSREGDNWSVIEDSGWTICSGDTIVGKTVSLYPSLCGDEIFNIGFSEDDVKYRKMCLKKTFVRLLFYDSMDMFEQRLLAYSTVFLDHNSIYSTWSSGGKPLSTITITNDRDTSRSSEGFYLYLFKQDLPQRNEEKTIYMKVEFNHAKFGRVIPFINQPMVVEKGGPRYAALNPSNYNDSLYTSIKIKKGFDNKYTYTIIGNNNVDNIIRKRLFEPKLEMQTN